MYSSMCSRVLLPLGDLLARQRVMRYLDYYQRSQYWPRERLLEEMDRSLRETVAIAYQEVPFYRDLYNRHRVSPSDVRGVSDLPKLPVVSKVMLREAFPDGCTRRTPHVWDDYSTSGSTGRPFIVRVDDDTMSRARALMLLRTMFAGWRPGVPTLQTGMATERGTLKWLKDRLMRVTYVSAFDLSDSVLDRYLELIETRGLRFVTGYAQSVYLLAKRARDIGFNRQLDGVVSWGSNMFRHYRREIEEAFGCRVYDSYGVGEGMQVSAQCGVDDETYHQFCLHVVAEYCREGEPVKAGELGEILLTRLDPGAMPLIRYTIGDVGRGSAQRACPCGRTLPLMSSIDGRTSDIVVTPRGNRLIVEFFFGIFQYANMIDNFQVIQEKPDSIHVKIVVLPEFEASHWQIVRDQILERGDPDLSITMEIVEEIPLEPSRKRRFVRSSVGF